MEQCNVNHNLSGCCVGGFMLWDTRKKAERPSASMNLCLSTFNCWRKRYGAVFAQTGISCLLLVSDFYPHVIFCIALKLLKQQDFCFFVVFNFQFIISQAVNFKACRANHNWLPVIILMLTMSLMSFFFSFFFLQSILLHSSISPFRIRQ